jgi:NADPH2:quinone reductase
MVLNIVIVAKAYGATVIATASTQEKLSIAKSFGADHLVLSSSPSWPQTVKSLTPSSRGVDIVYDPVGLVDLSTKCTAWNGRILIVGFAAGTIEKVAMNKVLLKNISLVGIHWGAYAKNQPEMQAEVWWALLKMMNEGKFRGTVYKDEKFVGLDRVKDALVALGSRGTWGKVVIDVLEDKSKL